MKEGQLIRKFMWRDRKGFFYNPEQMETKHLFFTLRMIWNHSAPHEMRIEPYQKYYFSDFYSPDYMKQAAYHITRELTNRTDLKPYYINNLIKIKDHMEKLFYKKEVEE